jgi:hypothetical protein
MSIDEAEATFTGAKFRVVLKEDCTFGVAFVGAPSGQYTSPRR